MEEIITLDGIYEVHPATNGGYAVVNSETGDVRCSFASKSEAIRVATQLNADAA